MDPSWHIPRRTLLRGVMKGAAVAVGLPFLEAMVKPLHANEPPASVAPSVRLGVLFFPNGVPPAGWKLKGGTGPLGELSPILAPLAALKDQVNVISNTWHPAVNSGDGHYFKDAAFLTGTTITKTTGADINVGGISLDQLAAQHIGQDTRLPSLELGTEPPRAGVDNNVQVTQVYGGHISWSSPTTPVAREIDPAEAFDRLFRDQAKDIDPNAARRRPSSLSLDEERSILDVITDDARLARNRLGRADQRKMDEYLQSLRDLERRMVHDAKAAKTSRPTPKEALSSLPSLFEQIKNWRSGDQRYRDHTAHSRLLLDIMAMAFWTDQTRVASLMFGISVSGRNFGFIDGVTGGHHDISHHQDDAEKLRQYELISTWHVEQLAYFLDRLKGMDEYGMSVLDRSCILFGSGLSDGNAHSPRNLPIILAGRGGGAFKTGRHIACNEGERLSNVYLEITRALGMKATAFADSTGGLKALAG